MSTSPSPEVPPSFEAIARFMATYTAKMPSSAAVADVDLSFVARFIAPYEYNGCDYSLALAACFPTKCVDLSKLNWSEHPLVAQLRGNLSIFCEAAKRLALPDAPTLSLHPSALQPEASCVVHHIKVQHWLYSLSVRFPPDVNHFDPVAIRAEQSWRQLGTPFLAYKRERPGGDEAEKGAEPRPLVVNDAEHYCHSVCETHCLSVDSLRALGNVLMPTPLPTEAESQSDKKPAADATGEKENKPTFASLTPSSTAKSKPWLTYSKPWRLPAIEAANARRAKADETAARQRDAAKKADPTLTAFATGASSLKEQFDASENAVARLRLELDEIRSSVFDEIVAGHSSLDYPVIAARLRKAGVTPDLTH